MTPAPSRRASRAVDRHPAVESPLWDAQPLAEQTVRDAIAAAAAALSTADGEVSIVLTDDAAIRDAQSRLARHRQADQRAVVSGAEANGRRRAACSATSSLPMRRSRANATMKAESFLHHLAHLTVHGFLHLIGYDHQTDAEADAMEGLESKIMTRLNMPDPYLARDLGPTPDRHA